MSVNSCGSGRFNSYLNCKHNELAVARMNVDSFDGLDLSGAQCFKADLAFHSVYPGIVHESNATTEAAYKLVSMNSNPYWKRYQPTL